jgi:hypothetical protein
MNSGIDVTGNEEVTAITLDPRTSPAMGAKSRLTLKLNFS